MAFHIFKRNKFVNYTLGLCLFYFLHQLVGPLQTDKTTLKMEVFPLSKMNLLSLFSLVDFTHRNPDNLF